jgi:hypothetical protein
VKLTNWVIIMGKTVRKAELKRAIAAHLESDGRKNWAVVQSQFPEITDSTFWRTVKSVLDGLKAAVNGVAVVNGARAAQILPAAQPAEQMQPTDFLQDPPDLRAQAAKLDRAADLLEASSTTLVEGNRVVTDFKLYKEAQKLRVSVLNLVGRFLVEFQNVRDINALNRELMAALDEVSPGARERILAKVQSTPHVATPTPGAAK